MSNHASKVAKEKIVVQRIARQVRGQLRWVFPRRLFPERNYSEKKVGLVEKKLYFLQPLKTRAEVTRIVRSFGVLKKMVERVDKPICPVGQTEQRDRQQKFVSYESTPQPPKILPFMSTLKTSSCKFKQKAETCSEQVTKFSQQRNLSWRKVDRTGRKIKF